jgi:hypothetical protein
VFDTFKTTVSPKMVKFPAIVTSLPNVDPLTDKVVPLYVKLVSETTVFASLQNANLFALPLPSTKELPQTRLSIVRVVTAFDPFKVNTVSVVPPESPLKVKPPNVGLALVRKSCGVNKLITLRVDAKLALRSKPCALAVVNCKVSVAVWNENPFKLPETGNVESANNPVNPAPFPINDPENEPDMFTPTAPTVRKT